MTDETVGEETEFVLTAGAVAKRLGIAAPTLRSWHYRYGIGPGAHESGRHRRYTRDDLRVLERMRELMLQGVPPAHAAKIAREGKPLPSPLRSGGGAVIPVGAAGPAARGLGRAAVTLDAPRLRKLVCEQLAEHGVVATWEQLLVPLLHGIERKRNIAVEHVASWAITAALHTVPPALHNGRLTVLAACAPDEQHCMPLEALAAAATEQGWTARVLGARVPAESLLEAVDRAGPLAVAVWAHDPAFARQAPVTELRERGVEVLACGPGWQDEPLPAETHRPATLSQALTLLH